MLQQPETHMHTLHLEQVPDLRNYPHQPEPLPPCSQPWGDDSIDYVVLLDCENMKPKTRKRLFDDAV